MLFFSSLVTCQICKEVLIEPVFLQCGNTVCKKHAQSSSIECPICDETHEIPSNGLPRNNMAQSMLELHFDKLNMDELGVRGEAKRVCADIHAKINGYESMKRSPLLFLTETIRKEIAKIDLKREQEIERLDKYYGDMIVQIREFEEKCKSEIAAVEIPKDSFETILKEVENDEIFLHSFESDETRCKAIFDERSLMSRQRQIEKKVNEFKDKILMNKRCRFEKNDFVESDGHRYLGTLALYDKPAHPLESEFLTSDQVTDLFRLCEFESSDAFVRIYSGSQDGFEPEDGHAKCDGVANLLCIIQVNGNENIFGGYTTATWESITNVTDDIGAVFKLDKGAFIFSLVNKHDEPSR